MRALLVRVKEILESSGISNAQREAEWIIEAVTGLSRGEIATAADPEGPMIAAVLALAERRAAGEPLQYVTGVVGFRHLELQVGPGVFIPRPETEVVAGRAMEHLPQGGVAIEIGTGSGAIALSIADERPDASVLATEHSAEALEWAQRNRETLGLDVEMVKADLFDGVPERLKGTVDLVVSNPPYVPEGFNLSREVMEFEPHVALFADDAGLGIIRKLLADAKDWLRPGGWVVLEIGEFQRDAVARLLNELGFDDVQIHLDLAERARIAEGRWNPT